MLRRVFISLYKFSRSEGCFLVCQPRRTLVFTSCSFTEKNENGETSSSESESSDSESDAEKGVGVDEELKKAAESVAKAVPDRQSQVKSDLLQQLKSYAMLSKKQAGEDQPADAAIRVSDLLSGMRVTRQRQAQANVEMTRGDFQMTRGDFQKDGERRPRISQHRPAAKQSFREREALKLFHGPDLGIFTVDEKQKAIDNEVSRQPLQTDLWQELFELQLKRTSLYPPSNAFEEMIEWTESGKLWTFPINNEQGMEEEAKVGFHQHIFLEDQIKDFPRHGPIRHFMELVITGLSKNPFLTVQQKHEHIDWFRQYFKQNKSLLEESLGKDGSMTESASVN